MNSMSKENHTITLTDAELYALWAVATWFDRPVITSKLKYKLAGMANHPDRQKLEKRFDSKIEDRIIDLGERLPHIREDMAKRRQS
jgi:hypothetical protein